MDWAKIAQTVGKIAPTIAASLATGGASGVTMAIVGLCGALGLDSATATPDAVQAAIVGATPEQLQAIRQADQKHQEVVMQAGLAALATVTQAAQADMADTRNLAAQEIAKGNVWTTAAAALVRPLWGIGSFVIVAGSVVMAAKLDSAVKDLIELVVEFYFGSRLVEKLTPHIAEVMNNKG